MSRFFFSRPAASEPDDLVSDRPLDLAAALRPLIAMQSITASAIFAKLVSKGVMTADEAGDYMAEIAQALEFDVDAPVGASAAEMLRAYGEALSAAGRSSR